MLATTVTTTTVSLTAARTTKTKTRTRTTAGAARRAGVRAEAPSAGGIVGALPRIFLGATGHDVENGFWGFTPAAELWVGRWAMLGFTSGVAVELFTDKGGIVEQIGLSPSPALAAVFWATIGAASAAGSAVTLLRAATGEMTVNEARRYAAALGVDSSALAATSAEMQRLKEEGKETSNSKVAASDEDVLTGTTYAQGEYMQWPKVADQVGASSAGELEAYSRQVEINNGRAAMIGFALAVGVELSTGHTTIMQIIDTFRAVGLIGDAGGFNW